MKIHHTLGVLFVVGGAMSVVGCGDDDDVGPAVQDATPDGDGDVATVDGSIDAPADAPPDSELPAELPYGLRDRAGRPFVSLLLLSAESREDYNATPVEIAAPSDPAIDGRPTFGGDFQAALALLDALDGVDDWNGGAADAGPDEAGAFAHPLVATWISPDVLLVDPSKPFSASSYLDLELNGDAHATCGGRWLDDDALDKTMSFLVNTTLEGVSDGVAGPARPASMSFPYLATPF